MTQSQNADQTDQHEHLLMLWAAKPVGSLAERFPNENSFSQRLIDVRWADGITCPRCATKEIGSITSRKSYYCMQCKYQFTPTTGTILHRTHLELQTWFVATEYIVSCHARDRAANLLTVEKLKSKMLVTYKVAHRVRKVLSQDLLQQDGGLLWRCICA